ncbi:molybdate ABC transporter substrate-binding protein [Rhizobiaceae bacterium BDR2-2]|uniref:Molybdate ABC transporter substrate-binding protein n=1 Tax=Ectorhizobium quercum TaxID=2965071 RepID=A0AAE3SVR0_9HYPH|nr:molybdate ABC transporter substrate-binding protein [Ectorhizobium quercum]MCX8996346.1 molybdate ABC transporter substrate-binding protein [Ectorhizobium quercum]MCX8998615.1 molybdate ABC transporter substrate-binding protein [Ectorhizobium quercum]
MKRFTVSARLGGFMLMLLALFATVPAQAAEKVTVFAAASLKDVLTAISDDWKAETGNDVVLSFAGSSALAKQIGEGAPADVFISADLDWMDNVEQQDLLKEGTRFSLLANRIVLVAPADSTAALTIAPGFDLAGTLGDEKLAMANTDSVPAGKYGKAALEKLGVWDAVAPKVAQAENVRAALLLVARGEAPLGIVYETDAKVDPQVKIVDRFPEDTHAPIIYPAAVLKDASSPVATAFLDALKTDKAKEAFEAAGFTVLAQ